MVVVAHPNDLRFVAVQHFQLFVDEFGNVHVFGGVEIHAAKRVHIIDRHKPRPAFHFRMVVGKRRRETGVEHQTGNRRVVGHIIVGVVRDDKVGVNFFDDVHHFVARFFVVVVNFQIVKAAPHHFKTAKVAASFRFACAHCRQFVGGNDFVSQVSAGKVANHHSVAAFLALQKRTRASNFHIVGVTGYNQNRVHNKSPYTFFCNYTAFLLAME